MQLLKHHRHGNHVTSMGDHSPEKVGNFILSDVLGKGAFGKVQLGTHVQTGHTVAVKILNKAKMIQQGMKEQVEKEIEILRTLGRHPNIAPLYDVIDSPTNTYLVLENIGGGELYDFLIEQGTLDENEARRMFIQLVEGIDYCHSNDIIHRDLKLDNLLLDSHNNIKISDFGLSKSVNHDNFLRTTCGTPHYVAPEILSRHPYHGPEVDVWACGVILYALLSGYVPFEDESTPRLFEKIMTAEFEMPKHLSESVQDLLSRILEVDPEKRITIAEMRQHSWIQGQPLPCMDELQRPVDAKGTDPLDQYLPRPRQQQPAPLEEISEHTELTHEESSCTYEPTLDDDEAQKHRSKDNHRHRKWQLWPSWRHNSVYNK